MKYLLIVSVIAISNPVHADIQGSWFNPDAGKAGGPAVVNFTSDGHYYQAQAGSAILDPTGQPGMEYGTYSYDGITLSSTTLLDTNGQWGLSNPLPGENQVTLAGDTLTVPDNQVASGQVVFTRVQSSTSALVGGWEGNGVAITFLENGEYLLADKADGYATDPCHCGQPGMEFGTYSWSSETGAFSFNTLSISAIAIGAFSFNTLINTDGEYGLSDSGLSQLIVNGNVLTSSDGPTFTRVEAVPLPGSVILFGSGLLGLTGLARKRKAV